jgi:hypothetical protein
VRPRPEFSPDVPAAPAPDVVAWRAARLTTHGFDAVTARRMARDLRYDLHAAIGLIERGCPPHLAARILAPLDPPDGAA